MSLDAAFSTLRTVRSRETSIQAVLPIGLTERFATSDSRQMPMDGISEEQNPDDRRGLRGCRGFDPRCR